MPSQAHGARHGRLRSVLDRYHLLVPSNVAHGHQRRWVSQVTLRQPWCVSFAVLREVLSSQSVVLQGMDYRPELPDHRVIHVHPW